MLQMMKLLHTLLSASFAPLSLLFHRSSFSLRWVCTCPRPFFSGWQTRHPRTPNCNAPCHPCAGRTACSVCAACWSCCGRVCCGRVQCAPTACGNSANSH